MAGRVCGRAAGLLDLLDNLVFEVDHVARVAHQACGSEGRKRGVRARAVYTCTRKQGFNTTLQGCTRPGHARASAERLERIARGRGGFDGPNTLQHVMQVFITSTESRSPRPLQAEPHSAGGGVKRLKTKTPAVRTICTHTGRGGKHVVLECTENPRHARASTGKLGGNRPLASPGCIAPPCIIYIKHRRGVSIIFFFKKNISKTI